MRPFPLNSCAHTIKFCYVHKSIRVNFFRNHAYAARDTHQAHHLRLHIGRKSRIGKGLNRNGSGPVRGFDLHISFCHYEHNASLLEFGDKRFEMIDPDILDLDLALDLAPLARVLKRGAEFRVATDIPDYVRQTLEEVPKAGFAWTAEGPDDWRHPWEDWLSTRYEQKAFREGRRPHYLTFRRL